MRERQWRQFNKRAAIAPKWIKETVSTPGEQGIWHYLFYRDDVIYADDVSYSSITRLSSQTNRREGRSRSRLVRSVRFGRVGILMWFAYPPLPLLPERLHTLLRCPPYTSAGKKPQVALRPPAAASPTTPSSHPRTRRGVREVNCAGQQPGLRPLSSVSLPSFTPFPCFREDKRSERRARGGFANHMKIAMSRSGKNQCSQILVDDLLGFLLAKKVETIVLLWPKWHRQRQESTFRPPRVRLSSLILSPLFPLRSMQIPLTMLGLSISLAGDPSLEGTLRRETCVVLAQPAQLPPKVTWCYRVTTIVFSISVTLVS